MSPRVSGAMLGLDEEDADFIEAFVRERWQARGLVVDRARLKESHEAWVHVLMRDEPNELFEGFGPYPRRAVLTWPNSD